MILMNTDATALSSEQAYQAMFYFLEDHYMATQSDDTAVLLGSMVLESDGMSRDPAMWDVWQESLANVHQTSSGDWSEHTAILAMQHYLTHFKQAMSSSELGAIAESVSMNGKGIMQSTQAQNSWRDALKKSISET